MSKARPIDGSQQSDRCLKELQQVITHHNLTPRLDIIYIGSNSSSKCYIDHKRKKADKIGIQTALHSFPAEATPEEVYSQIAACNADEEVDGIIVQLPVPEKFETQKLINAVKPEKDVDGLHPVNFGHLLSGSEPLFYPPTPKGIMDLLEETEVEFQGAVAAIVGMGRLVGKPLSQMLLAEEATVLCLHEETVELAEMTRQADILVTGAGVAGLIGSKEIKEGAVVIDAGINRLDCKLVGDVNYEEAEKKASWITPVPGGVGPMTVACLLSNTVEACQRKL